MSNVFAPAIAAAILAGSLVAAQAMPVQKAIGARTEVTRVDFFCGHGRHFKLGRCVRNHEEPPPDGRDQPRRDEPRRDAPGLDGRGLDAPRLDEPRRDEPRHEHRGCPPGYHMGEHSDRCRPNRN